MKRPNKLYRWHRGTVAFTIMFVMTFIMILTTIWVHNEYTKIDKEKQHLEVRVDLLESTERIHKQFIKRNEDELKKARSMQYKSIQKLSERE